MRHLLTPRFTGLDSRRTLRACRASREASARIARAAFQMSDRFAEWPEARAKIVHDRLRLLPRGKVTALRVPLVVDQLGVGLFGPTPRGRAYFIWEHTHDRGDGDPFRCKEGELVLPIETRRRNAGVRQPVERDVVENVVPREALGLTVKDACDQFIAPDIVVDDPGREGDRGIRNTVQRLRTMAHLQRI